MDYNIIENVPIGIIISEIKKSKILYMNRTAKQFLKIYDELHEIDSLREILEYEIVYEKLQKNIFEDMAEMNESEGIVYLKTLENTFIEVEFHCVWHSKEKGEVAYIFKRTTDVIGDLKLSGENQVSFKEITEYLPSGIVIINTEQELYISYANPEHYKILGIETSQNERNTENNTRYLLKEFVYEEDLNWVVSEISLSFAKREDVDIEFRIKTMTNEIKWVRLFGRTRISSNGEKLFYSSLKDLSKRRSLDDKAHMEKILFQKITELTEETIFRLDIKTKVIHFLGQKNKIFGELTVFENYPESVLELYKIYEDDIPLHEEMQECFEKGIIKSFEMRYCFSNDTFEWYEVTYSFIKDMQDENILVIGKISNIHKQKLLEEQAKTDLLSGFYNKITTEHETNRLINFKKNQSHAFFIIDIDHFKDINDNLGHHFGDMVLTGISEDIRNSFRKNDLFGRIGGDEFVVVMRDIVALDVVIEKAEQLCQVLRKTFRGNNTSYSISASIGISMFPSDGKNYEELYKKSDAALYEIKKSTKNGYKQFNEQLSSKTSMKEEKNIDKRVNAKRMNAVVISTVLNSLYETNDVDTSINSILAYLGSVFKLDKCYIFETFDAGKTYFDSYRWCKNEVALEMEIDNSYKPHIFNHNDMDRDGIFYTNDISTIQDKKFIKMLEKENVKSIFLKESRIYKNKKSILVLEDCEKQHIWSEEDVVTLMHVARLLFTTIFNQRLVKETN